MLGLAIPVGLVLGLLLGGSLRALGELPLRGIGLLYAAIGVQVVAFPSGVFPWTTPERVATALWLVTYAILALVTVLNRALPGALVVGAGMLCNLIAVSANGGHMPMLPDAARGAGIAIDGVLNNSVSAHEPHVPWLVDRWAAPSAVPLANVYSVGDVLIFAGAVVVVAAAMRRRPAAAAAPAAPA